MISFFRKPLGWAVGAIIVLLAVWWAYSALTRDSKAEARLSRNQAEAASESGSEAVNTVGEAGVREAQSDALTRDNEKDIRNAEGADAPVAAPARDAGLASLCRRAAYRNDPKCLQRANP